MNHNTCPAHPNPNCPKQEAVGKCEYCCFDFDQEHLDAESLRQAEAAAKSVAERRIADAESLRKLQELQEKQRQDAAAREREHEEATRRKAENSRREVEEREATQKVGVESATRLQSEKEATEAEAKQLKATTLQNIAIQIENELSSFLLVLMSRFMLPIALIIVPLIGINFIPEGLLGFANHKDRESVFALLSVVIVPLSMWFFISERAQLILHRIPSCDLTPKSMGAVPSFQCARSIISFPCGFRVKLENSYGTEAWITAPSDGILYVFKNSVRFTSFDQIPQRFMPRACS